ncbi:MAG: TPM domain-containing protein [Chitinophagales bacterium]
MPDAKDFFSEDEQVAIIESIRKAEQKTSGEVRLHLENRCGKKGAIARAEQLFHKLKMDETELRNGVLIYLAIKDHQFAIIGDKGINELSPEDFWENVRDLMQEKFKNGEFLEGICEGIELAGEELQKDFPDMGDDKNELPDDISYNK